MFECLKRTELKTFDSVQKKSKCVRIAAKTKGTIFTLLVCVCACKMSKATKEQSGKKNDCYIECDKTNIFNTPTF